MAEQQYLVIARKWRPQRFEDVVGQDHITRTLRNAIASGRIHHAFLFIGSRGIGKTTTARILAKALNCLSSDKPTADPCGECENCKSIGAGGNIDVIEIDGASNNGVDDIRELRENIQMVPSSGRYKVYIIDEVHQLSIGAFNALLKTLEEPPSHAIFVLATTEAHKIPATIISRCQRYDFRRVPIPTIIALLKKILEAEGVAADDEALHAIARTAEGGIRDAESLLDELITYCDGNITFQDVNDVLGLIDWRLLHSMCEGILKQDIIGLLQLVDDMISGGKDLSQFVQESLFYFRNLLICKNAQADAILHLPEEEINELRQQAAHFSLTHLIRLVEQFAELSKGFDSQLAQRIALEAMLIRVAKVSTEVSVDTVMEKLLALGAGGLMNMPDPSTPPPEQPRPAVPPSEPPAVDPPQAGPAETSTPTAPAAEASVSQGADDAPLGREAPAPEPAPTPATPMPPAAPQAQPKPPGDAYDSAPPEPPAYEDEDEDDFSEPDLDAPPPRRIQPTGAGEIGKPQVIEKAGVTPEEIQRCLQDPGIAQLVDTFKGKIVMVRKVESPTETK